MDNYEDKAASIEPKKDLVITQIALDVEGRLVFGVSDEGAVWYYNRANQVWHQLPMTIGVPHVQPL